MVTLTQHPSYIQDETSYWNAFQHMRAAAMGRAQQILAPTSFVGTPEVATSTQVPASKRRRGGGGAMATDAPSEVVARGSLPPPNAAGLVSRQADLLPTPAEVSNTPHLLGEHGGPGTNPSKEMAKVLTANATAPAAVAPVSMGLTETTRAGPRAAVSTTHTPDAGVEASAMERAKQLPSSTAYQQAETNLSTATAVNSQRRMSLFRGSAGGL